MIAQLNRQAPSGMFNPRVFGLLVVIFATSSAFPAAPSRAAINANAGGNRALDSGRYDIAVEAYEKALKLAEDAGDAQYRAIAMYGLARANARLCRTTLAEKWFRDSISLRESIADDSQTAFLTQNLIEFARFLLSIGRTEEAVAYFGRALPKLESLGIEQIDPIGYADLLGDVATAQLNLGKAEESKAQADRAAELRQKYPGRKPGFRALAYPVGCKGEAQ